ncbi:hypothetical protein A3H38_06030 [candidate division WOR-1 bacterium RIFCSPLOWO2_02_FULL_46_20]|uniref:Ligand-binding protein SH3 n=2 Tax=Saganbacteria TaxID=1703751 RepID=A0A1F4RBJ4_UNCSA|nr:MAG: hypothetical protein A3J44_02655 [candidate division WOR-1 bacterium RIFCSPHIGHO2_02_FULL_45_12]OGC05520.1 MAG: hypothetical protein A3H38_06030 [candidate division WOR-1 bacterium RIFCSPLOWO2_02_FULL_46_20]OGC09195.1 MAG: hypothetical protein A3F86_05580 [candidate division WOR-1 bacterium RIFCSPLOWO2_12_FULL_45_9]
MVEEIIVFFLAAIPIFEVRASVPLGVIVYKLQPTVVIALSVLGSVLPVFPLLWFLNTLTERLCRFPACDHFFTWLFTRTRSKSQLIEDFELVGLVLFIGVPLPGTGVWTGVIAAHLLGLRWWPTFLTAAVGTTIASLIMWAASAGMISFFL